MALTAVAICCWLTLSRPDPTPADTQPLPGAALLVSQLLISSDGDAIAPAIPPALTVLPESDAADDPVDDGEESDPEEEAALVGAASALAFEPLTLPPAGPFERTPSALSLPGNTSVLRC